MIKPVLIFEEIHHYIDICNNRIPSAANVVFGDMIVLPNPWYDKSTGSPRHTPRVQSSFQVLENSIKNLIILHESTAFSRNYKSHGKVKYSNVPGLFSS